MFVSSDIVNCVESFFARITNKPKGAAIETEHLFFQWMFCFTYCVQLMMLCSWRFLTQLASLHKNIDSTVPLDRVA